MARTCPICRAEFAHEHETQAYCSKTCRNRAHKLRRRTNNGHAHSANPELYQAVKPAGLVTLDALDTPEIDGTLPLLKQALLHRWGTARLAQVGPQLVDKLVTVALDPMAKQSRSLQALKLLQLINKNNLDVLKIVGAIQQAGGGGDDDQTLDRSAQGALLDSPELLDELCKRAEEWAEGVAPSRPRLHAQPADVEAGAPPDAGAAETA